MSDESAASTNFIRNIVIDDLDSGKHETIQTRFPPEPNGFLHIGHAKSICLNFGLTQEFPGSTNLRFDDTNPLREEELYVDAIKADVEWLGFEWAELRHASDYFQTLYDYAEHLIEHGHAYVDSLDADQMREYRGTLTEPGKNSPYRDRPVEESLDLFRRMKAGEFDDGEHVLRAKINMASPNINMRDPALYRIRNTAHHRTGDEWHIYPMYDYAHCVSDALEGITHSLCTLEFEDHRPLYNWILEHVPAPCHPRQIEFARGNLDFTVMSKRKLRQLVEEGHVSDWDDPRMPTIAGLRRRGYTATAIREFWAQAGVSKADSTLPVGTLENALRNDLNEKAPRTMGVLDPLKIELVNFPEGETEWFEAAVHPQDESMGTRQVPMTREIWIEQEDFMEEAPKKFFRLKPGGEVRLRNAFIIQCVEVVKDADGNVQSLKCELDPESRSGMPGSDRRVKGTIHWVSAEHGVPAEIRVYDRLFNVPNPLNHKGDDKDGDFTQHLNPDSLEIKQGFVEQAVADGGPGDTWQFERLGYFTHDKDSSSDHPVLNRAVPLRDSWAKLEKHMRAQGKW